MSDAASKPWPTELRLHKDRKTLTVAFDNGESYELSAEYLRVRSPSAEVQGHSPAERKTVAGKKNVEILEVAPVGNYAVRLTFDDMHATGIYSWDYLATLGRNHDEYWQVYLDELAAKGLKNTGSENYGGPMVTAGGLLFIGATNYDKKFHAFDKSTGELLWETTLPFAGNATPITYSVNGRQYVVIAAGGGKDPRSPSGGEYVAFALPPGKN